MRTIDFQGVNDVGEFSPVPEGRYLVEVEQAEEDVNKNGDDRLNLRLRIVEGEHEGSVIFDRLFFSSRALPRVKLVLQALGADLSGPVDVTPDLFIGRRCYVDTVIDTYVKTDGSEGRSNAVPYAGYHSAGVEGEALAPY